MGIIDFHTHAFPDALAERVVPQLEQGAEARATLDGKLASLRRSMDTAGIEASVVCSIATRPDQFRKILDWSLQIASARIIPFPSVHPAHPEAVAQVHELRRAGFKGVKLHPYYQDFFLDEARLFPVYEAIQADGLVLLCHTGFDMAYERTRRADPERIARVIERFPALKFVATHLGAWDDWEEVRRRLLGRSLYFDTSYSLHLFDDTQARRFLLAHPADRLLFGTDSPWADQREEIRRIERLGLPEELLRKLFADNADALLAG